MSAPTVIDVTRADDVFTRFVRTVAAAAVCTATASIGHLVGGGTVPPEGTLVVFAGAAAVAGLLSARQVTPAQLVGLLILGQAVMHLGFAGAMAMPVSMLAAHAAATILSAIALARGESYVWSLAGRLGLRATPATPVTVALPAATLPTPVARTRALRDVRLAHARVERGPPTASY